MEQLKCQYGFFSTRILLGFMQTDNILALDDFCPGRNIVARKHDDRNVKSRLAKLYY